MVNILNRFLRRKEKLDNDTIGIEHFMNTGTTGTEVHAGRFDEEYLQKIQGLDGIDIFDEMRRSDGQVKMLLSVVKNPILSATWFIEPVDDSEEEIKIGEFIEHILFRDMNYPDGSKFKTWTMLLEEALSFIDFGHSVFEVIHKVVKDDPVWGNYIGLKDIAFRGQKTIEEWNLDPTNGALMNIRQCVDGDLNSSVNIPGKFLLVFSMNKEGDNYEGISQLRPIYGNWFRKNVFRKIQAIGLERNASGVPVGKLPQGVQNNTEQFDRFKAMLSAFLAHQQNYLLLPDGYDVSELKISHDAGSVSNAIETENKEMSKAFLANFMELGINGSGSFALGSDLADIAMSSYTHIANRIQEQIDFRIIRVLVNAKFGKRHRYPMLKVSGINNKAGKEFAEIINMLVTSGIITKNKKLERAMRKSYDLPEITEEELEDQEIVKPTIPDPEKPMNPGKPTVDKEGEMEKATLSEGTALIEDKKKDQITLADPEKIVKRIDDQAADLRVFMQQELDERSDKFLAALDTKLRKAKTKNEMRTAITNQSLRGVTSYRNQLAIKLAEVSERETRAVMKELKIDNVKLDETLEELLRKIPKNQRDKIRQESKLIVETQDADLEKNIKFQALNELETSDSVKSIIAQGNKGRRQYIDGSALVSGATNFVSAVVNTTRNDIFQTPEVLETIETFIFTNRDPISQICKHLTGRVFTKQEYALTDLLPPLHHNCKSFIVAQTVDVKGNRPASPLGLEVTGTEKQVEAILKSKTF